MDQHDQEQVGAEDAGRGLDLGHKDLKFVDIEAPEVIVERLLEKGIYRPKIFFKNIMQKGTELKEAGLLEEEMKVSSLFDEDEMVKPLAGEIPMEVPLASRWLQGVGGHRRCQPSSNFVEESETEGEEDMMSEARQLTRDDVGKVERELEELCRSIVDEWKTRMIQSPLAVATCETLGKLMKRGEYGDLLNEDEDLTQAAGGPAAIPPAGEIRGAGAAERLLHLYGGLQGAQ